MTEQILDPNNATVGYMSYVRDVHNELVRRTGDEANHVRCTAELDAAVAAQSAQPNALMVSGRGIRSAFATFCFKQGARAEDMRSMPIIANGEFPSPSAMTSAMMRFAERHLSIHDLKIDDTMWGLNPTLNAMLSNDYYQIMGILMGTARTEEANSNAGVIDAETERIIPYTLVETDCDGIITGVPFSFLADPFNDGMGAAGELLTLPQNLLVLVDGLVKVPAERRGAAAAEIIRYANNAPVFDQDNEFSNFVEIAVSIYG